MASEITWKNVYRQHATYYETLVSFEDYQGHLPAAIQQLYPLNGAGVVEFGAGTGRVSACLASRAAWLGAFDLTPEMLAINHQKLKGGSACPALTAVADSRSMPVASGCADLAVEGWSFLHIRMHGGEDWRRELGKAIHEMFRVLKPGGMALLIETLGAGQTEPTVPPAYRETYTYLEQEFGFLTSWIRTDYHFTSVELAQQVIGPLFGEDMLSALAQVEDGWILPECTGLWWLQVA